jgi:hypothetical protein
VSLAYPDGLLSRKGRAKVRATEASLYLQFLEGTVRRDNARATQKLMLENEQHLMFGTNPRTGLPNGSQWVQWSPPEPPLNSSFAVSDEWIERNKPAGMTAADFVKCVTEASGLPTAYFTHTKPPKEASMADNPLLQQFNTVENLEEALKYARKRDKQEKKNLQKRREQEKVTRKRKALALATLEEIAGDPGADSADRITASKRLLLP